MKLVYRFGKNGRLRFVSHLDLQRFVQRALNRTDLPIAFSQGFNPHPVMSLASALAMGYESEYEVLELKIQGQTTKVHALETMRAALPAEMPVYEVRFMAENHPSMMSLVRMTEYRITPANHFEELREAAEKFMAMTTCPGIRKTKSGEREIDLRPLCLKLEAEDGVFTARLMLTETDTLKPDLLMDTLSKFAGIETPAYRVFRTCLMGEGEVPILDI